MFICVFVCDACKCMYIRACERIRVSAMCELNYKVIGAELYVHALVGCLHFIYIPVYL